MPSPEFPYKNSGLYALDGFVATARQAACANLFDEPTINVSKVYSYLVSVISSSALGAVVSLLSISSGILSEIINLLSKIASNASFKSGI